MKLGFVAYEMMTFSHGDGCKRLMINKDAHSRRDYIDC